MRFEKINKNKIKVNISSKDLQDNDMDIHSFMSNSSECKSLFLYVLQKAERDYGFSTNDYSIKVETIALDNGSFVLTITRTKSSDISENAIKNTIVVPKKTVHMRKKVNISNSNNLVYSFRDFEEFLSFVEFIKDNKKTYNRNLCKKNVLYFYNDLYYLVFQCVNKDLVTIKSFYSAIVEFAKYSDESDIFISKLNECGNIIFKTRAIENTIKLFLDKTSIVIK